MESITFTCKVITPMFLAGADGQTPELRAPSIKGAMRFWWRALNGELVKEGKDNEMWDHSDLSAKESKIFGNTNHKSSFSIKTSWEYKVEKQLPLPDSGIPVGRYDNDIFKFMTYGLWDHKNSPKNSPPKKRKYFEPESRFTLKILIRDTIHKEDILKSLYALVQFGGIGAKARNGFGSFTLNEIDVLNKYQISDLSPQIEIRDYSCFSKHSREYEIGEKKTWEKSLAEALKLYVSVKNKFDGSKKNYIAAHKPELLNLKRKPKFCFYKISPTKEGSFRSKVVFLPYILPEHEDKHRNTLISFIKQTESR